MLALVLRGWKAGKTKEILSTPINRQELIEAEKVILASAMFGTYEAFTKGHLASLLPERKGPIIVTRGRLGEKSMERVLGESTWGQWSSYSHVRLKSC